MRLARIHGAIFLLVVPAFLGFSHPGIADNEDPAAGKPPAVVRMALVYEDLSLLLLERAQLPGVDLQGLDHAWIWSSELAPQRIPAEAFRVGEGVAPGAGSESEMPASGAEVESSIGRMLDDAVETARERQRGSRLRVRIPPPPGGFRGDLSVLAGPAEMWPEIPEPNLPAWAVGEDGLLDLPRTPDQVWRLRVIGPGGGTRWLDVPAGRAAVDLHPHPAPTRRARVVGEDGAPLPATYVQVLEGSFGPSRSRTFALFVTDAEGIFEVPALAGDEPLGLTFFEPRHTRGAWTGRPSELPAEIALAAGATVTGRFVDPRGRPLAGVRVRVDGWLADEVSALFLEAAESDEDGRWAIPRAPKRTLALTARAPGYAGLQETFEVDGERVDLGDLVLAPGIDQSVRIVDDLGAAVAGAHLEAGAGRSATSDARGVARLQGLAADAAVQLRATAPAHLPAELVLSPPFPAEARLTLTRALTVRGRFTDSDGHDLLEAQVRVQSGNRFRNQPLSGGAFEIDLPPAVPSRLELSSPETTSLSVPVPPGAPGEVRDLGELRAPPGLVVTGLLISELDGGPVGGARVWALRPSPAGPLVAWVHGEVARTTSDGEGRFEAKGLPKAPGLLRIDAPGFARAYRDLRPSPNEARLELGEVELSPGTTLTVLVGEEVEAGARVQVDPRGDGLEIDLLTATLVDGRAKVPHVPAGTAMVEVVSGPRVLCDKQVEIPETAGDLEVECRVRPIVVEGQVLVAGEPAGPGTLLWRSPSSAPPVAALITNRLSPSGLRRQQSYGVRTSRISVAVDPRGTFSTSELRPGPWFVSWTPEGGSPGGNPREVEIPEVESHVVVLDFPGGTIRGLVVDADGEPVARAAVQEPGSGALTLSDPQGRFELRGLAVGPHRLQARHEERLSEVVPVEMAAGEDSAPVRLVLREREDGRIIVHLVDRQGRPGSGGVVFLEAEGAAPRMLMTDTDGEAAADFPPPFPSRVRLAAFHAGQWFLGPWRGWDAARGGLSAEIGETGSLVITSEDLRGTIAIEAPSGWNLTWLLARLGSRPAVHPGDPLLLAGLPPGAYRLRLGPATARATVEAGEAQDLELSDAAGSLLPEGPAGDAPGDLADPSFPR